MFLLGLHLEKPERGKGGKDRHRIFAKAQKAQSAICFSIFKLLELFNSHCTKKGCVVHIWELTIFDSSKKGSIELLKKKRQKLVLAWAHILKSHTQQTFHSEQLDPLLQPSSKVSLVQHLKWDSHKTKLSWKEIDALLCHYWFSDSTLQLQPK